MVFFGDFIPPAAHEECARAVSASDGMLVLGSSLVVLSATRYVEQASGLGMPVLIVSIGPTGLDQIATMKLSAKCSDVVKHINL